MQFVILSIMFLAKMIHCNKCRMTQQKNILNKENLNVEEHHKDSKMLTIKDSYKLTRTHRDSHKLDKEYGLFLRNKKEWKNCLVILNSSYELIIFRSTWLFKMTSKMDNDTYIQFLHQERGYDVHHHRRHDDGHRHDVWHKTRPKGQ